MVFKVIDCLVKEKINDTVSIFKTVTKLKAICFGFPLLYVIGATPQEYYLT
jgi:hypothetical protein